MVREPDRSKPAFGPADLLTAVRIPLAVAFFWIDSTAWRVVFLWLAGITDFVDGYVARRWGSSRLGSFLDPVADKVFVAAAFWVVLVSGKLAWWEVVAVMARDLTATFAFLLTVAFKRPAAIPARRAGKLVTIGQLLVVLAFLLDSWLLRPLAWVTAAAALVAIADYGRVARGQARGL